MGNAEGTSIAARRLVLVVVLTLALTPLALADVPRPNTPTEMWPSLAAAFVWLATVWDGKSRPSFDVVWHVAAQVLLFVGVALLFGWEPLDAAWMGFVNVGGAVLMLVLYSWFQRGRGWAPTDAASNLALLATALSATTVVALLGGMPYLEVGELDRLTLWWIIRGTVYAYVGGVTFLCVFYADGPFVGDRAPRWALALLVPIGVGCIWVTYLDPELPLTWFLLLPALVAGSILTPRGAAVYALFIALIGALATLHPINQFGYDGVIPGSIVIDVLITASTFITIHLAVLQDQRMDAIRQLEAQRAAAEGERVAAEEEAALLERVYQTMTDGLIVMEQGRRVVFHNDAARRLVGKRIPIGEDLDWVGYLGLRLLSGEPATDADLPGPENPAVRQLHVQNEGADRILEIGAWPMGDTGKFMVLFSDVTAERERLGELTGFAGVVAHDLRSPLTSLSGWLELIADSLEDDDPASARQFNRRAQVSSARMGQVIDDWLAYTVQRDGMLTKSRVRLDALLEEIMAPYGAAGADYAPSFEVEAEHVVEADRVLTKQLLANLIGNAVKYTPDGQRPHVSIRSVPDPEHGFVRVEVSDAGVGLPPGEEERVFEEFHRAEAHALAFAGTGLGLSLCRRIVNRHGGSIWARNNPDRGATFTFTLPAA
ncbi:HAMP domain-containing sensor histidine kinase [Nocardioides sp.]|uniref:sensor histidine kinase n=1 Tax=Nocardioides sp. TaxID=35761 RepID=UPI002ED4166F